MVPIWRVQLLQAPRPVARTPPRAEPGTFRPTKEQWAGITVEPIPAATFRPERVTEGYIAIDDDLTPHLFSPIRAGSSG
jgi:membrane fusion protein, heavy metal efflux system